MRCRRPMNDVYFQGRTALLRVGHYIWKKIASKYFLYFMFLSAFLTLSHPPVQRGFSPRLVSRFLLSWQCIYTLLMTKISLQSLTNGWSICYRENCSVCSTHDLICRPSGSQPWVSSDEMKHEVGFGGLVVWWGVSRCLVGCFRIFAGLAES